MSAVYTTDLSSAEINRWITRARLVPYLNVAGTAETGLAAQLYVWNARLASACMETIHHVEVLVRNAIDHQLAASRPPNGLRYWLVDSDVLKPGELRAVELRAVEDAIARIRRLGKAATTDRVVAGLPLSFWTRLVGTRYDELWKVSLHPAFQHGSGSRRDIAGFLNRILHLRNDIAHHQSLLNDPVEARHRDLLDVAAAIDPAAAVWIGGISRVPELLAGAPART